MSNYTVLIKLKEIFRVVNVQLLSDFVTLVVDSSFFLLRAKKAEKARLPAFLSWRLNSLTHLVLSSIQACTWIHCFFLSPQLSNEPLFYFKLTFDICNLHIRFNKLLLELLDLYC